MKLINTASSLLFLTLLLLAPRAGFGAELEITKSSMMSGEEPTPITISGFSGEALAALKFDLYVMGFDVESRDALYKLTGSSNGNVQGRLVAGSQTLLNRAYSGGSARSQAHALADDVVKSIYPDRKGIAGTKIAFRAQVSKRVYELYISDYDGHNAQAATKDGSIVAAPSWVPGAFSVLYSSYKNTYPDILFHDLKTGTRRTVADHAGSNISPAVSPDGRKVAMILSKSGNPDLWVSNIDGTGLKRLTQTRQTESSPCWSPDGRTICFSSEASGRAALYVVSPEGGSMRRLSIGGVSNLTEPDWSPDGKWLAFTRMRGGGFDICIAPARGGEARILVAGEDPCWAPNSRNIIYNRTQSTVSVLDVPTKQFKDIRRISGRNSQAAWAR